MPEPSLPHQEASNTEAEIKAALGKKTTVRFFHLGNNIEPMRVEITEPILIKETKPDPPTRSQKYKRF